MGKNQRRYAIYGALFGLCFPVIGTFIQCWFNGLGCSLENLIHAQTHSPLLWIIDSAPLFLGLFASYGGKQLDRVEQKNALLREKYDQMAQLRELADEANRAKSAFLANMSHEIRTPMNAISGLSYLALKEDLPPKVQEYLQKIDLSSKSLLRIINDILDFSKIEAGELSFEEVDFDLEEVVNNVMDVANIKLREKPEIELIMRYDPRIPKTVNSDPVRLRQVLSNLLDNSIKFTSNGEISLVCRLIDQSEKGCRIHFEVNDSGIGISKAKMADIFEPFRQEDDSTTRKYGGTGLGLVICRRLVEMMDGTLEVESQKGVGTSFRFDIDLSTVHSSTSTEKRERKGLHHEKVLLVDDSETALNALTEMLNSFNFRVVTATAGAEGIALYNAALDSGDPFSLIIADWYMPGMDGLEMIKEIRSKGGDDHSVLMITAYGADALRGAKRENMIDGYLLKPISPSVLFDMIQNVLSQNNLVGIHQEEGKSKLEHFRSRLNGLHVLLVEDNEINLELAVALLDDVGISCTTAMNGREAIQKAQSRHFDGILMDIQMPVMDGLTATRELRKMQTFKEMPIIAMTAHALVGEREKSLAAGMNEHVTKPINPYLLYETLSSLLKREDDPSERAERPAEAQTETTPAEIAGDSPLIPEIAGVDTQEGLNRSAQKADLYLKLLGSFCNRYSPTPDDIIRLWENREMEEIGSLFHSMGGVAGNLGAADLSRDALAISHRIKSGKKDEIRESEVLRVVEALKRILRNIERALQSPESVADKEKEDLLPLPDAEWETLRGELTALIEKNDPASLHFVEEILESRQLQPALRPRLERVSHLLDELEFEAALTELRKTNE